MKRLGGREVAIIRALGDHPVGRSIRPRTVADLACRTTMQSYRVQLILDRLEDRRLVERRGRVWFLTDTGLETHRQLVQEPVA